MDFVEINEKYSKVWDEFVFDNQYGNIYQTFLYYNLHLKQKNYLPFAYGVFNKKKVVGLISGIIQKNFIFPIDNLTKRAVIIGGPIIENNNSTILDFILKELTNKLIYKSIYVQYRNLWDIKQNISYFLKYGFIYEPHLNILNDLTLSEEQIKKMINKNKRGNINKSINKGVSFIELKSQSSFDLAIKLVQNTYRRIKLPCPPESYFDRAYEILFPKGILRTFATVYRGNIIGVRLELCYKDTIYDWYAGSDDEYKNKYPNDFLLYHILIWGKKNGYQKFDLGGAGKPDVNYGVREHKLKFGGKLVEYGRFERINNNMLMKIGKLGLKFIKFSRV